MKDEKDVVWIIDFTPIIGKTIVIETREGTIRKGALLRVNYAGFPYSSSYSEGRLEFPTEFILDDEPRAGVAPDRVHTFKVLP